MFSNIPEELQQLDQWVCWKEENGTKIPKIPGGKCRRNASSTRPETWRSFKRARYYVERGLADGIGFVFTKDDPYTGIDLDNKEDDPLIDADHNWWIDQFQSYTEYSPGGSGYHTIVKGALTNGGINASPYEAYSHGRYFTFTGKVVVDQPVVEAQRTLSDFEETFGRGGEKETFRVPDTVAPGNRNDTLFRLACSLRKRGFSEADVAQVIYTYNAGLEEPLPQKEVDALLSSSNKFEDYTSQSSDVDKYTYQELNDEVLIWVAQQNQYYDETRCALLKPSSVDNVYLSQIQPIQNKKGEEVRPPPSRTLPRMENHRSVDNLSWHPGMDKFFRWEGQDCCNTYRPTELEPTDGEPTLWMNHAEALVPDAKVLNHMLDWLAFTVQYPEEKINHGIFLGGAGGIGKDLFLQPVVQALGEHNCKTIRSKQLEDGFNEYLLNTKLLIINEMYTNRREARRLENELKEVLASPPNSLNVNIKHLRQLTIPNLVSVFFMSNHKDALIVTGENMRRYLCYWSPMEPETTAYYNALGAYVNTHAGDVLNYLQNRNVESFNPKQTPMRTEFSEEVLVESKDALLHRIEEMLDTEETPFEVDLVETKQIIEVFGLKETDHRYVAKLMREAGCVSVRAQKKHMRAYRLWACRRQKFYKNMKPADLWNAYAAVNPSITNVRQAHKKY